MSEVWIRDQRLVPMVQVGLGSVQVGVKYRLWIYLYLLKAGLIKLPRNRKLDGRKNGFGHAAVDILGRSILPVICFFFRPRQDNFEFLDTSLGRNSWIYGRPARNWHQVQQMRTLKLQGEFIAPGQIEQFVL
jgi:hypothetical protein